MQRWALIAAMATGCGPGATPPEPAPIRRPPPSAAADSDEAPAGRGAVAPAPTEAGPDADTAPPEPAVVAPAEPDPQSFAPSHSTSKGGPNRGRLEGGIALPVRAPGLLFLPHKDPGSRYGTVELVQGLTHAAAAVERADPGAPLSVGDLSRSEGGPIPGHASHRSGRDVDVLFYLVRESDDQPFVPSKFIPIDPQARGTDYGDLADPADDVPLRVDIARTWRFLAALLADEQAAVQSILIVEHLRAQLLHEAERVGAPAAIVQRFAEVTCQPRFPHDDHMHIRVFCSAQDIAAGCEDTSPIFPWRRRELKAQGVTAVLEGKGATPDDEGGHVAAAPKLKTIEQARAEAGPMHDDVVEFLDRRKAWASKPHPGRRYCR